MTFAEKLEKAVRITNSHVCVGMDIDLAKVPNCLVEEMNEAVQSLGLHENHAVATTIKKFARKIITATGPYACAYKPNLAFFEAIQPGGLELLAEVVKLIRQHCPDRLVILDGKRGDIGNTAERYATALKRLGADAVTVNPYLGPKTLEPFLEAGLGIIALCVTSNKDAAVFQNVIAKTDRHGEIPFYQHVALTMAEQQKGGNAELWQGNLGLVAGATHPEELGEIRSLIGNDIPLLIPGIGKQEGSLEKTLKANKNGPAVINVSRSVLYASTEEDYAEAAGAEAKKVRDAINACLE